MILPILLLTSRVFEGFLSVCLFCFVFVCLFCFAFVFVFRFVFVLFVFVVCLFVCVFVFVLFCFIFVICHLPPANSKFGDCKFCIIVNKY